MNNLQIKCKLKTYYTAYKWLKLHKQKSADEWLLGLFINELNMDYLNPEK